jgi:lipoprotein-releasing system permease protein
VFGITLAGQVLAGLIVLGGTILLASRWKISPERALAVAGTLGALVALGSGFFASAIRRKLGFWEVLIAGLIFTISTSVLLGRMLLDPFGAIRPVLSDIAYLSSMLSNNPLGGVAVAAVVLWGATFVGGSLGFLLAGSGRIDLGFSYESFVARRHLRLSKSLASPAVSTPALPAASRPSLWDYFTGRSATLGTKKSPTRLMTLISIGGVAVGVLALTVVLSVMSGFELDLKSKIIGTNAHAVVLKYGNEFKEWAEVAAGVRKVKGVMGATPFILNEVMVSSDQNISGALIKGIDPSTVSQVTNLADNIKDGNLDWLGRPEEIPSIPSDLRLRGLPGSDGAQAIQGATEKPASQEPAAASPKVEPRRPGAEGALSEADILGKAKGSSAAVAAAAFPGIVLGRELAHSLRVMVGDRINVVSPLGGELGPTGPVPKSRPFKVAGIFFSGMYEYDAKFAYIALPEAQRFFGMGESVTGLELKTDDIDNTRQITRNVLASLDGYPYRTKDWGEMNKNLFSALRLEKLVMAVILAFIVLVACFNIISTLIMMVLEKSKEIAILKSMGSTDTSVMKIFVIEGLIIGLIGTAVGLVLGYLACLFVQMVGIRLDAEVYYIDKLPVKIDAMQFAVVAFLAVLLSYLATIYPATRASRVAPVDGLRNE